MSKAYDPFLDQTLREFIKGKSTLIDIVIPLLDKIQLLQLENNKLKDNNNKTIK